MNKSIELNNDLASVAKELRSIPQVEVDDQPGEDRILVHVAGRRVPVQIVTRASGYPRDVREAVWQARPRLRPQETLLLHVPALTATSREWLQNEGIAYLDGLGNLFLAAEGVYLFRESATKPVRSSVPAETNIFRGRATQVLHALLHVPERSWHVTDLAQEASVAPGTALKVCEVLEKMLLMERQGRGPQSLRRLLKPGALLDAWADKHRLDSYSMHRYYRWMQDLDALAIAIGEAIQHQGAAYAVTMALGAMHRAPYLTQINQIALLLPVSIDLNQLASDCRLQVAEEGYNVLLLATRTEGPLMYRQQLDNLWIASDIQLYLDLFASPGRGREQAQHLRRERLRF